MLITVLKSKIHCARVTEANLNYMGSITIDEDLMDAAAMLEGEQVRIIMAYAQMTPEEAREFKPTVIFPKAGNKL